MNDTSQQSKNDAIDSRTGEQNVEKVQASTGRASTKSATDSYVVRADEVAILVPTKDRHKEIRNLLQSIQRQSQRPGQIIIVDSGESVKPVCDEFAGDLNINYFDHKKQSQVLQRNYGIGKAAESIKLIACFDDDNVLEPDAIENILAFYNRVPGKYGAVSFNIVNRRGFKFNIFKYIFGMSGTRPGKLLPSGYNTNMCNVKESMDTDWVFGGATLWRKDVLQNHLRNDWYGSYAFTEDVEISHKVRKHYALAVCAEAKIHDMCAASGYLKTFDFGRKQVLIRIEFARRTEGLSPALATWACVGQTLESFIRIFVNADIRYVNTFMGNFYALIETALGRRYKAK